MIDPHAEYTRRLETRRAAAALLDRRHVRMGNVRLAIAAAAAVMFWFAFARHSFSGWWLILPAAAFAALAIAHDRVIRARDRARRGVEFWERGLARIEDRWTGLGEGGERFDDPVHPYAEDLDLFGKGSLFELLSTARLRCGEEELAGWLLAPAPLAELRERHAAISELRGRLDLREDIALLGEDVRSAINPQLLAKWAEQPLVLDSRGMRIAVAALSALAVASAAIWAAFGRSEFLLGVLVLEAATMLWLREKVSRVVELVGKPAYGLELLAGVLARFERERFTAPLLERLRRGLDKKGAPPSHLIARLNRIMDMLHSRDNVAVKVLGTPLLWTVQTAFAIEAWRKKSGPSVRHWLVSVGQLEALCALAAYAYEHPGDPFPEFVESGPLFEGVGIAHPLLPESRAVRNDVNLGGGLRVMIVSGSNMSGKSTLLRTVGINIVLAMAGAPVRARSLRLSPLAAGASIRTLDSLQGGTSRFYAEIKRLHAVVELTAGPLPLLFLLDELLHGTNSHDRLIGGEAVVRTLVERGAVGLVTTHDLALSGMVESLGERAANVHFEDQLRDGHIAFDYHLRPGIVQKSNALELMRSVGLDV
jgi:hypothetical protein